MKSKNMISNGNTSKEINIKKFRPRLIIISSTVSLISIFLIYLWIQVNFFMFKK